MPIANPSTGNLEDTRHLKAVIDNLQQRLTKLEANAIPFLAHQKGAVPGAMRAVQIGDVGLAGNMWMSLVGNQPSRAPYQAVTDLAGVTRVELGNLAANGNSPAQYGLRVNKSDGTALFDSGAPPFNLLGSNLNFSQQSVTGNGSFQTVSGSTVSFTTTRVSNLLVLASGQLLDPTVGDTGYVLSCGILLDSAFSSANGPQVFNTTTGALPVTPFAVITSLSAASHSVAFGVQQTNTHLWSVTNGYIYVFQLLGGA